MLPTLVVVSGPPGGYGKTTLAHKIARTIGCPAICRDEIKEGMVHVSPGFQPGPGDRLTQVATPLFFDVLALLLRGGSTVVAEAAFQNRIWKPGLEPLTDLADLRIIRCSTDADTAYARGTHRHATNPIHRAAHSAPGPRRPADGTFDEISLSAPRLAVDTKNGYNPSLRDIAAFINSR